MWFIGFRLKDQSKARAQISRQQRRRNAFANVLWKCTRRERASVASSCMIIRLVRTRAQIRRRLQSKRVSLPRVYSCFDTHRTQTASQFLRAITPVDYNYEAQSVRFARVGVTRRAGR